MLRYYLHGTANHPRLGCSSNCFDRAACRGPLRGAYAWGVVRLGCEAGWVALRRVQLAQTVVSVCLGALGVDEAVEGIVAAERRREGCCEEAQTHVATALWGGERCDGMGRGEKRESRRTGAATFVLIVAYRRHLARCSMRSKTDAVRQCYPFDKASI
jgi:hypothetical protein